MPAKSKTVRLSKAAKEFNVGIATIVEFLASNGHDIDANPNTKIDGAAYDILKNEFQDSKTLKEKSKLAGVSSGKRETVSLERNEPQVEKPAQEEQKEILIKNVQGTQDEDIIKPSVKKGPGVSVVGKIDLDKKKNALAEEKRIQEEAQAKEKQEAKAKEEASKKEEEAKKEAKSAEEAENAKTAGIKAEAKKEEVAKVEDAIVEGAKEEKATEEQENEAKAKAKSDEAAASEASEPVDDNTIRTNVGRLAGPT